MARSMLSRRLAQPSIRADGLPSAAPAVNSAQARTDSGFHCTIVCCGLNLATCTAAPQWSHPTHR